VWRALLLVLAACTFDHGVPPGERNDGGCTTTPAWWDGRFVARFPISVSAPPGYTLRIDASAALAAGPDVRVVVHEVQARELDRVLESPAIAFKVPPSGSVWLYAGPGAGAAMANPANVYLFAEDFEALAIDDSGDGPFIPQPSNEWRVADDNGNRVYHAAGINRHPAAIRNLMPADVELSARMRIGAGGGENHNGLAARSNSMAVNTMDGFVVQLQENVQRARIGEYANGVSPSELAGVNRTIARQVWYRLRMRLVGDAITFHVDDQLAASATRSGFDGQMLGLFAYNCDVDYDDVRVQLAMMPEPTATIGAEQRCR
jgi:hypothetical protein